MKTKFVSFVFNEDKNSVDKYIKYEIISFGKKMFDFFHIWENFFDGSALPKYTQSYIKLLQYDTQPLNEYKYYITLLKFLLQHKI